MRNKYKYGFSHIFLTKDAQKLLKFNKLHY